MRTKAVKIKKEKMQLPIDLNVTSQYKRKKQCMDILGGMNMWTVHEA